MLALMVLMSILSCQPEIKEDSLHILLEDLPYKIGSKEYLESPYVTAGDRVYSVGHQDGSFPDLGWHVTDEMGGIWNHPIKIMDGFQLAVGIEDMTCLANAELFTNYSIGNKHEYADVNEIKISRMQFVPDSIQGLVIEYLLKNTSSVGKNINLKFTGRFDLRPVWLAEKKGLVDSQDSYKQADDVIIAKDANNNWYGSLSSSLAVDKVDGNSPCKIDNNGLGVDAVLNQSLTLAAGETKAVKYFITGSHKSESEAIATINQLKQNSSQLLKSKIKRLAALNDFNVLITPDSGVNTMYEWVRYNNDWLMRDVPEEGRGISAGIPDYPWWFGTDSGYAVEGLLAQGQWEDALSTIDLIIKLSERANGASGKIMHEASTNGIVFNPGNLNTTPRFIQTLWMAYSWTGRPELLNRYYDLAKKGIAWIESQDKDENGYPDGPGMMEIHGLHTEMIDVVAYQEQAYRAGANFALAANDLEQGNSYLEKSKHLRAKINSDWWAAEFSSYADFRATKKQAVELIEAAIVRADTLNKPWAVEELKSTLNKVKDHSSEATKGYVVHHNWVVNTPMETGSADTAKALAALETARSYQNRFGMFVTGIDRDEEQETATKWKAFSYVGAVMTLPTGVQAIGAARYGKTDVSYGYLKNLENSFSYALPGSMYEVSPDFGMVTQAWNSYAVAVPIIEHYFGIKPIAHENKLILKPKLPKAWQEAQLLNVRIGDNLVSLRYNSDPEGTETWNITQTLDWEIEVQLDLPEVVINGKTVESSNGKFKVKEKNNSIKL